MEEKQTFLQARVTLALKLRYKWSLNHCAAMHAMVVHINQGTHTILSHLFVF